MKGPDPIHAYVAELSARLERHGLAARRSLQEVEDHLRDATASFRAAGLPEADAIERAIADFGPAQLVAERLDPILTREHDPMQRILSILIAFNVFTAATGAGISLVTGRAPIEILRGTLLVALVVIACSALTFVSWRRDRPVLSLAAGVVLLSLGSAGVAWTLARGIATGDPAYWATMFSMFYATQGLLTCGLGWRLQTHGLRGA